MAANQWTLLLQPVSQSLGGQTGIDKQWQQEEERGLYGFHEAVTRWLQATRRTSLTKSGTCGPGQAAKTDIAHSDPDVPLEDLLQEYLWRWDIEVNFKDEKCLLGVSEALASAPAM
jgi:hypothetical protein